MAVGDVLQGISSVNASQYMDIRPTGTEQWVIHNVYHEAGVELEIYNGTTPVPFDSDTGTGVFANMAIHVTNGVYLRIKNTDAASKGISYDGVVTRL